MVKAIIYTNWFALNLFIYNLVVKVGVNAGIDPIDFVIFYNVLTPPYCLFQAYMTGVSLVPARKNRVALLARCVNALTANLLNTFGLSLVTLVTQQVTQMTTPFWAALMAWVITRETITQKEVFSMVLSFVCIVFMSVSNARSQA